MKIVRSTGRMFPGTNRQKNPNCASNILYIGEEGNIKMLPEQNIYIELENEN